jgi:hypothetical protein
MKGKLRKLTHPDFASLVDPPCFARRVRKFFSAQQKAPLHAKQGGAGGGLSTHVNHQNLHIARINSTDAARLPQCSRFDLFKFLQGLIG